MIYFNGVKGKSYFEGWFFKISSKGVNLALIPSISVCDGSRRAYVQINCNGFSKKYEYDFADFTANDREAVIGGNVFSSEGIKFDCEELHVDVKFGAFRPLEKDIMGCFKFGTPCKHKIISMKHFVTGSVRFSGQQITFENAVGYAEKDWGNSFPKGYCWLQCNDFLGKEASFFFSAAKIGFPFMGLICVLMIDQKEYRFATYNFSHIKELKRGEIILKKSKYTLRIKFDESRLQEMLAPERGKMERVIKEDLDGTLQLQLFEKGGLKYDLNGQNAGIEWVKLP